VSESSSNFAPDVHKAASDRLDLPGSACDLEPITRLERIQSFGFLIAVSRTWVVVRVSANLESMLVALEAEDLLRSLGAASIVAVSTIAAAANVCETSAIDFAVLDINLGFENSLGFAASLRVSKTPFLFASGYGEQKKPGESLLAELTVSKPYDRDSLQGAVALTLARATASFEKER
jgi:hypothetical protein